MNARATVGGVIAVFCLGASPTSADPAGAEGDGGTLAPALGLTVMRDTSRRFEIVGTNRLWNMSLMRWAEVMTDKVGDITGLDPSFQNRVLRILVLPASPERPPGVAEAQAVRGGEFIQQLTLYDYEKADVGAADTAMCRLLLNGYVVERLPAEALAEAPPGGAAGYPGVVPDWLAVGVARNFYPALRAQNAAGLLDQLDAGRLPAVATILAGSAKDVDGATESHQHACGMLVAWWRSWPEKGALFDAIFRRLAEGRPLSADWLAGRLPGGESDRDLEDAWKEWSLRQKRVIYEPGVVTSRVIRDLEAALAVREGDYGVPEGVMAGSMLRFEELVPRRREKWVAAAVANKRAQLQVLFVGRGPAMNSVIEAYGAFLDALARGRSERRVRKLLREAEALKEALAPEAPDPDDSADGDFSRRSPGM